MQTNELSSIKLLETDLLDRFAVCKKMTDF